jgi:hypothetical protein
MSRFRRDVVRENLILSTRSGTIPKKFVDNTWTRRLLPQLTAITSILVVLLLVLTLIILFFAWEVPAPNSSEYFLCNVTGSQVVHNTYTFVLNLDIFATRGNDTLIGKAFVCETVAESTTRKCGEDYIPTFLCMPNFNPDTTFYKVESKTDYSVEVTLLILIGGLGIMCVTVVSVSIWRQCVYMRLDSKENGWHGSTHAGYVIVLDDEVEDNVGVERLLEEPAMKNWLDRTSQSQYETVHDVMTGTTSTTYQILGIVIMIVISNFMVLCFGGGSLFGVIIFAQSGFFSVAGTVLSCILILFMSILYFLSLFYMFYDRIFTILWTKTLYLLTDDRFITITSGVISYNITYYEFTGIRGIQQADGGIGPILMIDFKYTPSRLIPVCLDLPEEQQNDVLEFIREKIEERAELNPELHQDHIVEDHIVQDSTNDAIVHNDAIVEEQEERFE